MWDNSTTILSLNSNLKQKNFKQNFVNLTADLRAVKTLALIVIAKPDTYLSIKISSIRCRRNNSKLRKEKLIISHKFLCRFPAEAIF